MPISYYLIPNPISKRKRAYTARISPKEALSVEDIIQELAARGSTVSETDARAVLLFFFEVVSEKIAEGAFVNLPIANIRPTISGEFDSPADAFDEARHRLRASLSPGVALSKTVRAAKLEKTTKPLPAPQLLDFRDVASNTRNAILTPGGIGQISGAELKFKPENPEEGIFFIKSDGSERRVQTLALCAPRRLIFSIPSELTPGAYQLEVRRVFAKDGKMRKGALLQTLQAS